MSGASCLYRRPSGIYAVRLVVPVRLRGLLGQREIHESTGLRDWNAAKVAALKIQTRWREQFMTLDLEKLVTASPLLHGGGLISICEAAAAIGLSESSLLGELLNDRASVFVHAQHWHGWYIKDWTEIEIDPDGTFVLNNVHALGERRVLTGNARAYNPAVVLSSLLTERQAAESVFHLDGLSAFWLDDEQPMALPAWMAQKATIERVRERLAGAVPPEAKTPAKAQERPPGESWVSGRQTGKRFSDLFALYAKRQEWKADHRSRMEKEARLFSELMNDPLLTDIGVEMIHEFAELLQRLPYDIYQAGRRHPQASLRELMQIAEQDGAKLKAKKTANAHVARVGQIFAYGVSPAGLMEVNPADKFKRPWNKVQAIRPQDARQIFDDAELTKIFSQDWFMDGRGAFGKNDSTDWRPHYFWLPILALTTGGRLNELSQLYLDDVCRSNTDASVWYLDFNLDQPDKADMDDPDIGRDKSLKTVNAFRVVPLHELVIRAGLPEYVEMLRQAGETRLFPELRRDKSKGYGKPAGSWFNERFLGTRLGIERNGKKTFHSLRHNFATAVERYDNPERVIAQLLGHERGKSVGSNRYVKDRGAAELNPVVQQLEFPILEKIGTFDVQAGKRAIQWAMRLKQSQSQRRSMV